MAFAFYLLRLHGELILDYKFLNMHCYRVLMSFYHVLDVLCSTLPCNPASHCSSSQATASGVVPIEQTAHQFTGAEQAWYGRIGQFGHDGCGARINLESPKRERDTTSYCNCEIRR